MISYRDLVSRADTSWLQEKVGIQVIHVLQALDPAGETSKGIRDVFLALHDPYDVLAAASMRNGLFELLRQGEADDLASALGLKGDPYEALTRLRLSRGSEPYAICCAFLGLAEEVIAEQISTPAVENINAQYGLFDHQQKAVLSTLAALESGRKRVVLHMPTGAGKTRMAMHVVCRHLSKHPQAVIIWLANSEELCEQAAEEFIKAWNLLGNRSVDLFRFWGQKVLEIDKLKDGLLIAGFPKLHALARREIPRLAEIGDRTSLLVVDEAHQAIAPTYELIIQGLAARQINMPVLGLTATPGRTWNDPEKDRQLANFFDRKKVTLQVTGFRDPVEFLVSQGFLAAPTFRQIELSSETLSAYEIAQMAGDLDIPEHVLKKLAADERRSVKILREIEELYSRHPRTIVFATTVNHAQMLTAVLTAKGVNVRCVTGATSVSNRTDAIAWFKSYAGESRVIINYGVLTTGFDAPQTSAALIARPTKSLVLYSQMVGRAIRGLRAGGNAEAEIVTIVDTDLPGFGDLATAFSNWEDVW